MGFLISSDNKETSAEQKMGVGMELKELLDYKNIVILCHNIPDADTISCGFAIGQYLKENNVDAKLIYGGWEQISKPNLVMMVEMLQIDIAYTKELPENADLLLTVDCQYGAGNVQKYDLPDNLPVWVIDHHRPEIEEHEHTMIRPQLGSCATLVWDMLCKEGFDVSGNYNVSNALYYGLYTDTNGMAELSHPLDRDLGDISYDGGLIRKLRNSAITPSELDIVGDMLRNRNTNQGIAVFASQPCDPNLLGFASDIAQQTAGYDCCIMFSQLRNGLKLSIRTSAREIMASEIAAFLCKGVGGGGGNVEKAGGFMGAKEIKEISGLEPEEYLRKRVGEYLLNYDHIYAGKTEVDFASMPLYRKLPKKVGFARSTDIFPDKTRITIRTLEGDVDTTASDDIYLMIGILGEVYPIKRETFDLSYKVLEEEFVSDAEYIPAIMNRITGEKLLIKPFSHSCVPVGEKLIRARPVERDTKVFTNWDLDKYFFGQTGDFLAANEGRFDDCYIIRNDIFFETYELVSE